MIASVERLIQSQGQETTKFGITRKPLTQARPCVI